MAEVFSLALEKRARKGTAEANRLRKEGMIPGNIYGHKQEPVMVKARRDEITPIVRDGHKVVEATIDGTKEPALIQEVQWDTFGKFIQHFDLLRVDANERVTVEVPIEMRGESPGVLAGGVLRHQAYSLTLEVAAFSVPDSIIVRMAGLEIGDIVKVGDLDIPEGATAQQGENEPVLEILDPAALEQAAEAAEAAEAAAAESAAAGAEPEKVGGEESGD